MEAGNRFFNKFRESYVDTLANLYQYATSVYANNWQSRFVGTDDGYTYKEFKRTTNGISKTMSCYGIGAGDGVAILSQNMPNWAVAFFAATAFGRVSVPILPDSSQNEVTNMLTHSETKVLFVSRKLYSKVTEECRQKLTLIFDIETLEIIQRDPESFTCDGKVCQPNADDLAALIYTSGTTGNAKGVMLSHRNLCQNILASLHCFKGKEKDVWLSILPMAHTYEMSIGFLYPFFVGACVNYLDKPMSTTVLMNAFKTARPTIVLSVPLIIEKVVKTSILPTIRKSPALSWMERRMPHLLYSIIGKRLIKTFGGKLRFFGVGGAKLNMDVETYLRKLKFPYAIGYGLTEAAPLICTANPKETGNGTIGCASYGVQAKLMNVNPETGEGEIIARGDNIMLGYYKDPVRTRSMFTEDGWLRTNDLAYQDEKGRFYIRGRLSNMILGPSGENIYPEELEKVINEIDSVNESLVLERDGKLVALVQLDESAINWKFSEEAGFIEKLEATRKAILDYVNKRVNKSSKISSVEVMRESFQKTATQKIRRFLYKKTNSPSADSEDKLK